VALQESLGEVLNLALNEAKARTAAFSNNDLANLAWACSVTSILFFPMERFATPDRACSSSRHALGLLGGKD
jgi:hypothetical protein